MRSLLPLAVLLFAAPALPAQQQQSAPPATHQEAAEQLIDLLLETEACLAGCTDAAGVQAALPRLRELAVRARLFKAAQDHLPEPTTHDYIAAQELLKRFNTTWQAIRDHIERLRRDSLLSRELSEILVIAPDAAS